MIAAAHGSAVAAASTLSLVAAMVGAVAGTPAGAAPAPALTIASAAVPAGEYSLTLPTGDRVTVTSPPDGKVTVDVVPADRGGAGFAMETHEYGEDYYVIPADAAPYFGEELDEELFNVTGLIRAGYHDDGIGELPLIVSYPDGVAPERGVVPDSTATTLASADAVASALTADTAAGWWQRTLAADALATVDKIWLDRPVYADLADSVPMIGAPQLWDAGVDGTGTTIAILDTGIAFNHPDVSDKVVAEVNFSIDLTANDLHGHGTHVASIAAGTGQASSGLRTGVAKGADLVNAKVLNQSGFGQTSGIIQAMEWVSQTLDVDVANLSLAGGITDGTDPLSTSLNQLTEQTDTLFVVAAGNDGRDGDFTIGSPGSASNALTVGAVDKTGELADFSSRGPRYWDSAIKPDLVAPGVDIIAARAPGTSMGDPVDANYTMASGTSMATPHVAGGAALLRQLHPDWTWQQVKAALVSTAALDVSRTIYEQGGGLVQLPEAAAPLVLTDSPTLDLGYFEYPHEGHEPASADLTYTNPGTEDLSLVLNLVVRGDGGQVPPAGMLSLSDPMITVPAGGSVTVTVTVDATLGEIGLYGGYLTASHEGISTSVRTPVGFHKDEEQVDLTIQGIDTVGEPAVGLLVVINVEDERIFHELVRYDDAGLAQVRVPPGTYAMYGTTNTRPPGERFDSVRVAVAEPEITLTRDTRVVFDTREAVELDVTAPKHEVAPRGVEQMTFRRPEIGLGHIVKSAISPLEHSYRALPTDTPVTRGYFEYGSRVQLADPADPFGSDVLYDVVHIEPGRIPDNPVYQVFPDQLARSDEQYHVHVPDHPLQRIQEFRHWWRPWQDISGAIGQDVPAPLLRTEYLSPADTRWSRTLSFAMPGQGSLARMLSARWQYQVGDHQTRSWMRQPVTPSMDAGTPWHIGAAQQRVGDTLELLLAEFGDAQPRHYGYYTTTDGVDSASFRLYQDGVLLADQTRPRGSFPLSPDPSRLRLELTVGRDAPWWTMSTQTVTSWELDTARPADGGAELLPLLLVDYDLGVDLENRWPANRGQEVGIQVRHQAGATAAPVDAAQLWVSYDDGASWDELRGSALGGGAFSFSLPNSAPPGAEFASLRLVASDGDGNLIEQEITRAWAL